MFYRLLSVSILTAFLGLTFWLAPNLKPEMLGATTPERVALFFTVLFAVFWVYLCVQGYPISHGHIGSSSEHNLDNIISSIPAGAALFGLLLHFLGFWPVSYVNIMLACMALAVVVYDMWILGGAASKINRLTDEFKGER